MELDIPRTYEELLERESDYKNAQMPRPEVILQNFGFKTIELQAQAPVFFVVDYIQKRYLFIDPSCKKLLGYEAEQILEAGPSNYVKLWHQNDFQVFNRQIFPQIKVFLKQQPFYSIPDYSFSFNYRIATPSGIYKTVLQRSTYYLTATDSTPLAVVGFIVDITNFKENTKIIFTIERIDRNYNSLAKEPIHKSVYTPDKKDTVLSKRELEVLQCIHAGMSSKQIADKLFIAIHTVHNHRKKMLEKTNCPNTPDLLRYAAKNGLL